MLEQEEYDDEGSENYFKDIEPVSDYFNERTQNTLIAGGCGLVIGGMISGDPLSAGATALIFGVAGYFKD